MYTRFCRSVACSPFPIEIQLLIRYVAHLTLSGRSFGTISNHLSSLKHVNQLLGFGKVWDTHYRFQLVLRGAKRYLGVSASGVSIIPIRQAFTCSPVGSVSSCLFHLFTKI